MINDNKNFFEINSPEIDSGSLDGRYRKSWTEESLYFENKTDKQVSTPQIGRYTNTSFTSKKNFYFFIFLILSFSLITTRLIYLQIIKADTYKLSAENNRERIIPIVAERGLIYDRNNIQLTKNIPNFSLALVPQDLPKEKTQKNDLIDKLSKLLDVDKNEINKILDEYGSYSYESIIIKEDIDYEKALSILIESNELPGIQIQRSSKRLYLPLVEKDNSVTTTANSFAHVLGYIGKLNKPELDELYKSGYLPSDSIGKTGIEKSYENFMRGTYGKKRIEVNATGKEQSIIAEEPPKPGFHIKLAIDANIQNNLEKIIQQNLDVAKKQRASGIVMNPNTGEILALVSLPSFDNNDFSGGITNTNYKKYTEDINNPLFNRAIGGTYPSGSTIKPAIAAAALQEKIINQSTSFLSTGGLQIGTWFFPDWQAGGHGVTDVRKSLAWSVNTFYYYIAGGYNDFVGLGVSKITDYLRKFNFATKLGIDLPGEQAGFLPSKEWKETTKKERWYVGDTYNLSIGQGDTLVTPLQIAEMTATIANGGTIYKPQIVKSIVDPITKEEQTISPEIINKNFIDEKNISIVRLGMRDCVIYGSCRRLALLPFTTAGKTGTAQWSSNKENHAWFTSFAPFDNPEIVITIMVEEGGEGSSISVPIAHEFYRWWWKYTKQ
ncbi:MAG TPA: penicillin-binding protein 2 [Candidatus Magasanikbacteria bacterium]|nr:penicillin-binding protein 2 [Candidatus Magasanikbacteria bacterium]